MVGSGNDRVAKSAGAIIGAAAGSFQSVKGLMSESDSFGANSYSLQLNSQTFKGVSNAYTDNRVTTGWEQFLYQNSGSSGSLFIQFQLIGYQSAYGSCPGTGPPGGSAWLPDGAGDCYANSPAINNVPTTQATDLAKLSLAGYANYQGSGNDQVILCISGGSCYNVALTDGVVNLFQYWLDSEFNVFGYGGGSQANFNMGTTLTVLNSLKDEGGNPITPSCVMNGYTGETNNLDIASGCNSTSAGIIFNEGHCQCSLDVSAGSWYPAGPQMRTLSISTFNGEGAENTALLQNQIDFQADPMTSAQAAAECPTTGITCSYDNSHARRYNWPLGETTPGTIEAVSPVYDPQTNFFNWLDVHSPNPAVSGTVRWGFGSSAGSLNPFGAYSPMDFYLLSAVYDQLWYANPLCNKAPPAGSGVGACPSNHQLIDWMTTSHAFSCDTSTGTPCTSTSLGYTPPSGTTANLAADERADVIETE